MRPYTTEYAYQNFIDRTQDDPAHTYYGDNLDRLVESRVAKTPMTSSDSLRMCPSVNLRPDLHSFWLTQRCRSGRHWGHCRLLCGWPKGSLWKRRWGESSSAVDYAG